jgi:hypothetical protein
MPSFYWLTFFLPGLASNHDPSSICLLSSWDYWSKPLSLASHILWPKKGEEGSKGKLGSLALDFSAIFFLCFLTLIVYEDLPFFLICLILSSPILSSEGKVKNKTWTTKKIASKYYSFYFESICNANNSLKCCKECDQANRMNSFGVTMWFMFLEVKY